MGGSSRKAIKKVTFKYQNYSTDSLEFQTWVDIIFNKVKLAYPIPAVIVGLFVFAVGYLMARSINFGNSYLNSFPIYLGTFGIVWVCSFLRYGSQSIHLAYEELRPCFSVPDKNYKTLIEGWFNRMASHRGNVFTSVVFALLALAVIYVSFFQAGIIKNLHLQTLRLALFKEGWFAVENRLVKASIIAFYGLCIAFPLGTSFRLLILNVLLLLKLRHLPVVPLPNIIRDRLQRTTNFYIAIALSWLVGVSLFGVLFFNRLDFMSITLTLVLNLIALGIFLIPQLVYRVLLLSSSRLANQWILKSLYNQFNIDLIERTTQHSKYMADNISAKLTKMKDLAGYIGASARSAHWVYNPLHFVLLITTQFFTIISPFIKEFVKFIFHLLN